MSLSFFFLKLSRDGAELISCERPGSLKLLGETIPKPWGSHRERTVTVPLLSGRRHDRVITGWWAKGTTWRPFGQEVGNVPRCLTMESWVSVSAALSCLGLDTPLVANVDWIALVLGVHVYQYWSESWQPSSEDAVTSSGTLLTHQTADYSRNAA